MIYGHVKTAAKHSTCLARYVGKVVFFAAGFAMMASAVARAADIPVAVAANFTAPAKEIATAFHAKTGYTVALSFGASGQFYAQITQGAPFEVFLSADEARPKKIDADGLAVPGTIFTYAVGKLVLWSANPHLVDANGMVLHDGGFTHVAIGDPKSAPFGTAAIQTMKALKVYDQLAPKIVTGQSITQAYQFIASGNAELGFVSLSQVVHDKKGSEWIVPQTLYSPILQDAVLLKTGAQDPGAKAFLTFLQSPVALKIIKSYGYDTKPAG